MSHDTSLAGTAAEDASGRGSQLMLARHVPKPAGCHCDFFRDNGKENGNYYIIIGYILGLFGGLYRDSGKEHGNYYSEYSLVGSSPHVA